jgi:hypothetical protein
MYIRTQSAIWKEYWIGFGKKLSSNSKRSWQADFGNWSWLSYCCRKPCRLQVILPANDDKKRLRVTGHYEVVKVKVTKINKIK